MEQFLKSLHIYLPGEHSGNTYVIDIADSIQYDKILNILDNSDQLEEDDESANITLHSATNIYINDNYEIVLNADFDNDNYKLTIKERK